MFSPLRKAQLELKRVGTHLCSISEKITSSLITTNQNINETGKGRGIQLPSPQLTAHSIGHFVFTTVSDKRRSFTNYAKTKVTSSYLFLMTVRARAL